MTDHHRRNRALRRVITGLVLEAALIVVAIRGPAFRGLMGIGMVIVAVLVGLSLWHSARQRAGHDRRHADRRHPAADEVVP